MLRLRSFGIVVILVALAGMAAVAQSVSIQVRGNSVTVSGWNAPAREPANGWSSILAVYAAPGNVPPLLGTYSVDRGSLTFSSRFPFAPNMRYRAVFRAPGAAPVVKTFYGPHVDMTPSTRILHVYPTAPVLPSNQLRLFIYFSAPMSRGLAFHYIHLLDARGKVLPDVFLPEEELWGPRNEELTITFDPGRIKRGLTSNLKMGPPIQDGKRYTLVIDRQFPDARGVPLVAGFRRSFRGGPAIRVPPEPKTWHIVAPKAGTAGALVLNFPEPMNYPLLRRMLYVSSARGEVAGTVSIGRHETQWRFTPRQPWSAGSYKLIVDTALEDLAGNHIGLLFDIDEFHRVTRTIKTTTISLPFTVR